MCPIAWELKTTQRNNLGKGRWNLGTYGKRQGNQNTLLKSTQGKHAERQGQSHLVTAQPYKNQQADCSGAQQLICHIILTTIHARMTISD